MRENNPLNEYEITIPMKIKGNTYFDSNKCLNYYQKIICDFDFYLIDKNTNQLLISEIRSIFSYILIKFSTFCFNMYKNKQFLTICFEHYCFTFSIEEDNALIYAERLLYYLTEVKIHFISPNKKDYEYLQQFCETKRVNFKNFIFPNEREQMKIETEVSNFIKPIINDIFQCTIFNISRECLSTFIIRRFYYKKNYFQNQNFFKNSFNDNSTTGKISTKLKEFKNNDFILLRDISLNTSLAFYKQENFLVVMKYKKNFVSFDDFQRENDLYCISNTLDHVIKCFGYIKNDINEVTCVIFEFMSGGTIENYFKLNESNKTKKTIDKYIIAFQIIECLYLLHLNDIIHRDLKPDNIFINNDFEIFIGDLESSRIIDDSMDTKTLTKDIGSIIYASPEMINSQKYLKSTDIYSLGQVLFFIFNENHPYLLKSDYEIIKIKNDLNRNYNEGTIFDNFINMIYSKCISFDPNKRTSIDNIISDFINESFKQSNSNQFKFLFYLYLINNSIIEQKILDIYSIILSTELNRKDLLGFILKKVTVKTIKDRNQITKVFLIKLANNSNDVAINLLEKLFFNQNLTKPYLQFSIQFFDFLSRRNNSSAQYILGEIYLEGKYVEFDINKALHYLELSFNLNNIYGGLYLGMIYYEDKFIKRDINKALFIFSIFADQNNSEAQYNLGIIYLDEQNINKAIHYFILSANQNNQCAQFFLGLIYYCGKYVERDINKAIHYFSLSANQNNQYAQYNLGMIYNEGKYVEVDINKVIHYFSLSANQNNSYAQCYLGVIYYEGKFVEIDINKAIHFLSLSANQNNTYAQYNLGMIYYEGKYVDRNINKAIHFLSLSANQNNLYAQFYLGIIYCEGKYVEIDINKAIHFLSLSANQNNTYAQYNLGMIYYKGKYVERNINKAIHFLSLSANQNNQYAQFVLGMIYYEGIHVVRDINKAIHFLSLSANQNFSYAQLMFGFIYLDGLDIKQDIKKSINYFLLSAYQNNSFSLFALGYLYYNGFNIPKNTNIAIHYFTLSANLNNSDAQFALGVINLQNLNIKKSIYYFTLSSDQNNKYAQFLLGGIYYYNEYISRDIVKSINYLTLAAKQYLIDAQFLLGEIYYTNEFISRDILKAIHYFKEASSLNHSSAKNYLGIIYKNGDGVKKNIMMAIEYFNEAIRIDQSRFAFYNLSRIYYFGIDIEKDVPKAIELLEKALSSKANYINFFLVNIYFLENLISYECYYQILVDFFSFLNDTLPTITVNEAQSIILEFLHDFDVFEYNEKSYFPVIESIFKEKYFYNEKLIQFLQQNKIDKDFYDGFGYDYISLFKD